MGCDTCLSLANCKDKYGCGTTKNPSSGLKRANDYHASQLNNTEIINQIESMLEGRVFVTADSDRLLSLVREHSLSTDRK